MDRVTFTDETADPVGFEAQSSGEKSQKPANIQTEHIVHESEEVQVVETKSMETQTTTAPRTKTPDYSQDALASFLKRITPSVLQYLDEQHGTNAFDEYNLSGAAAAEATTKVQLINRLNSTDLSDFKGKISSVSWSTGGGTLAVGHSVVHHEAWCNDVTRIEFFNISKDNLLMSKPSRTIEVSSCVTSMMYHPDEPSILAAGLFNGDVLAWNLRDDSSTAPLQICTHADFASQIQWHERLLNGASALVSSSGEGYVFVHRLTVNFSHSSLVKKYKIAKEKNPADRARPSSSNGGGDVAAGAGLTITCFDFSTKDYSLMVVGTMCGGLYKCRLELAKPIPDEDNVYDPVVDEYDRHQGTVTCVKSSPTKNIFITSSADREIRVYDFDQSACLNSINVENTPIRLTWHFGNTDVFLAYGAGPAVRFFNVKTGRELSGIMLYSESRENASCLSFNPKREMVAIGDTKGNLEIWRIPRSLPHSNRR